MEPEIEHNFGVDSPYIDAVRIDRKQRGAFFTPDAIARYLARWAIFGRRNAKVLDPTCGDGAFLVAAAEVLKELGAAPDAIGDQVYGVDLHVPSIAQCETLLASRGLRAQLQVGDFFTLHRPSESLFPETELPLVDAVIGNPPFVRYQNHIGETRRHSRAAALRQGVRLSGLASSWAALLVHASSFLKPDGRIAMVLPTELLNVGYAEPVRKWLLQRFAKVGLVMFEKLQFPGALEDVVLLVASGRGKSRGFSLEYVSDGDDLETGIWPLNQYSVPMEEEGKWTPILLTPEEQELFRRVTAEQFVGLASYGTPELGTVTGGNDYFVMDEATRLQYELRPHDHVCHTAPPGTKYVEGLTFTKRRWEQLKERGERVWLFWPRLGIDDNALRRYVAVGEQAGVDKAYKCSIRNPWWRPPRVSPPDLFFTYMSHRYVRLVTNAAGITFLNSMHGVRLREEVKPVASQALPLLVLNSVTMLGAEICGRSYAGGILKLEPREAGRLPVPKVAVLEEAWRILGPERQRLDRQLQAGNWKLVLATVDRVLLKDVLRLSETECVVLHEAARKLRRRRLERTNPLSVST